METASSERDYLECLWRVLGRIVEMTTGDVAWSQLFGIGNFDEDNEEVLAQHTLWHEPRHHRYRLLMLHPRHLSPKYFKPSPEDWMATMREAADGLVVLHERYKSPDAIPPQEALVKKLTLSKGMRDVWRAIDELTIRDLPRQAKEFTATAAIQEKPKPAPQPIPAPLPTPTKEKPATAKRGRKQRKASCDSSDDRPQPRRCRDCGEWIRRPVARAGNIFICTDCAGEHYIPIGAGGSNGGAASDRQYHGGMFYRGEW